MIRYHISLFIFVLIACVLQQFIPAVTVLYDARILLLHLVFLCCAVTVGFSPMLGLAFLCGFLWDANNTLGPQGGDSEVYINQIDSLRFGYSILLVWPDGGINAMYSTSIPPWRLASISYPHGHFSLPLPTAEFLLITFVRGEWIFPAKVLTQIWLTAAMTMLCSPLIFAILFKLAKLFDFTIRYDGLKRRYFTPEAYSLDNNPYARPRYRYRIYILTMLVLVGSGVLMTQLYDFQINRQDEFRKLVPTNYEVQIREPGVRGEIIDRNGVVLAKNNRNYQLIFNLKEIHQDFLQQFWLEHKGDKDAKAPGIVEIINQWVRPKLAQQGIDAKYSAKAMEGHYRTHGGLVPFVFRDDLSYNQFAHFAEHNLELPGVYVTVTPRRIYPYGSLASHCLGYLKQWEKGDVPPEFKHYTGDPKGISGIEATMDQYMRGSQGVRTILKNEKGKNLRVVDYLKPSQGSEVQLTLDARIQYLTETVLRRAGRAAAVVMDPRTGEVLAMASVPDFNPNDFIPNITSQRYAEYRDNKSAPFLNRAISNFPPASTFKIPAAITASLNGLHGMHCDCVGYTAYGKAKIRCWKTWGHGVLGVQEAIQRSCNPYFMKIAKTVGTTKMVESYSMLGLGKPTGIRLPRESAGILPGSIDWQRRYRNKVMTPALTGMLAIGQGDSEATPLQMATLISAVANGGKLYQPRIVRKVSHEDLGIQISNRPKLKTNLIQQGLDPAQLQNIREGMRLAAHKIGGTARRATPEGIIIGAKTGTAQTTDLGIKTHVAWTVAFAPYDNPRYVVVAAVKRGGSGGKVAGPLVKLILTGLFAQEGGQDLPLKQQQPYIGNTDLISEISLPDDNPLAAAFLADGETGEEASAIVIIHPEPEEPEDLPLPTIRAEIDPRGSVIPRAIPIYE